MDNLEFVSSLRQLADWYEQHPAVPIPHDFAHPMLTFLPGWTEADSEQAKVTLREIGSFEKRFDDEDFSALKQIGSITLRFLCKREAVCVPKVVGKRLVARTVTPARPEEVIEEHMEDVIEWDCQPILKAEGE